MMLYTAMSFFGTFFDFLDLPVFWPLLLIYFLFVTINMALRQRMHMKKYGYTLSDFFKKKVTEK